MINNKEQYKIIVNDLYKFYKLFIGLKNKPYYPAPHMKGLCKELMKMTVGEYRNLCVSYPPRHLKSTIITETFPLWRIFRNPEENILIITNSGGLSEKFGIRLREYVREYGKYFNVYLSDVKHSNSYLMFCNKEGELYRGSIRIIGAGGSITGTDASLIVCDDVYKGLPEEFTPTALQKKINWFNDIVLQRQEPETQLIVLHTRYHTKDLIGYLTSKYPEDYKYINYPAINEDNTVLWPERYTYEELHKKQIQMGERSFNSIYQGVPLDLSSDFFNLDHLKYGYDLTEFDKVVRAWDIASSDPLSDGDFTAGLLMYRHGVNAIVKDLVHGQFGEKTKDIILATADGDGFGVPIGIETGVAAAGKHLFQEWKKQLKGFRVKQLQPIKSKVDRATPLQNAIYDGNVYLDIADKTLRMLVMDELGSFPLSEHDDIVDSMAYAYNYLFQRNSKANARFGIVNL